MPEVTPEQLLAAYASGYFPMAESADDPTIYWFYPKTRGVLPLEHFHTPKSLRKFLRTHPFEIRIDTAFREVMLACAERDSTWINETILNLYCALHEKGHAHSVECWREGKLVGGLYGVSLGGAFFGESMFTRETNASKTALVALVERLRAAGYTLLDAQYVNEHLQQFGIEEIAREEYLKRLEAALALTPDALVPSLRAEAKP